MSDPRPDEPEAQRLLPADAGLLPPAYPTTPPPPSPPGWAPSPAPGPSGSVWHSIAAFIVLVAVVAAAAGAGIGFTLAHAINGARIGQNILQPESPIEAASPGAGGSTSTSAIAAKVRPALVDINTTIGNSQAAGSGMIISPTGEILTNNHVVAQSTSITVRLVETNRQYAAHVVGVNVSQDVAVIQIDQSVSGLHTVSFATSTSVHVGDSVVAIGNALGQGGAPHATSGHVTALDQTITASEGGGQSETLNGLIQSDATIYEGDSGGALVNTSGQVVGMITAGQAEGFRSSASTVGYAISSGTVLGIVNRIRARDQAADLTYGQVGYLGVEVQNLDSAAAAQLGLNVSSGALVVGVVGGGPAASGGMTRYSVITDFGGTSIDSADTLGPAIKAHKPGDQVSVTWVTSSGTQTGTVTLGGVNP